MKSGAIVHVVDDDAAVRHSLGLLLHSVGHTAKFYASAQVFLDTVDASGPACLVTDVRMPDMSGLDLQSELRKRKIRMPVIIITGHGDVPLAVRAMKEGAMDVLEKPFNDQVLLDSISKCISRSVEVHRAEQARAAFLRRTDNLSSREREVMDLLLAGKGSKEIASELGISSKTVDVHRAHILEKMQVKSVIELLRLSINHNPPGNGDPPG